MSAVQTLTPYVVRHADGTLGLQAPGAVTAKVPARFERNLSAGLAVVNAKIRAGELRAAASGVLVATSSAGRYYTQDGSTGTFYNWWGMSNCISHADLNAVATGVYVGAAAAVLGVIIDAGLGALVAFGYAVFYTFDIRGNGSCLNTSWGGAPSWWSAQ